MFMHRQRYEKTYTKMVTPGAFPCMVELLRIIIFFSIFSNFSTKNKKVKTKQNTACAQAH